MKFDVETKLAAARTRLTIDKPFLGALVLRLPLVAAAGWCKTSFTDARALYYNPEYVDQLSLAETQFVLAREALHCALLHFSRRGHRVQHLWDLACDFAVNPILIHDGLTPPPGAFYSHEYLGMAAEEIYPFLQDNENESNREDNLQERPDDQEGGRGESAAPRQPESGDDSGEGSGDGSGENSGEALSEPSDSGKDPGEMASETSDPGAGQGELRSDGVGSGAGQGRSQSGQADLDRDGGAYADAVDEQMGEGPPAPLTPQERETLEVLWRQRLAGAAQQARQAGKLSGDQARLVEDTLAPRLPWRMLLAKHMTSQARDDYSYSRPSNRRGEPAILPSLRSEQLDVVVVIDTSGSIAPEEMAEFVAEMDAIKGQVRARVVLHTCDDALNPAGPWVFEPWESLRLPEYFAGGGGTNFRPAFSWVCGLDREPDLLIYFTDAEGQFPEQPPHFPVLWLVKGKTEVPWGQRVQLN
jgi:predicted metal-dependent peptidase